MLLYCESITCDCALFQSLDEPTCLPVGTEVSAKYRGAFCEAKVKKVVKSVKVRVSGHSFTVCVLVYP